MRACVRACVYVGIHIICMRLYAYVHTCVYNYTIYVVQMCIIYICMYIIIYIYTYVSVCVCVRVCVGYINQYLLCVCVIQYMPVYRYIACIYIYIYMWVDICICVSVCMHVYRYTHVYVECLYHLCVHVYTLHIHLSLHLSVLLPTDTFSWLASWSYDKSIHGWFFDAKTRFGSLWCLSIHVSVKSFYLLTVCVDLSVYRHICLWMSVEQCAFVRALERMIILAAPPQLQQVWKRHKSLSRWSMCDLSLKHYQTAAGKSPAHPWLSKNVIPHLWITVKFVIHLRVKQLQL